LAPPFRDLVRGERVAIVDDVVNAGSALRATAAAVQEAGGDVVASAALLRLGDTVLPYLAEHALPLHSLAVRANSTWTPDECPLCQRGEPLDT
jgi:orotate phosphoribosyltransferase